MPRKLAHRASALGCGSDTGRGVIPPWLRACRALRFALLALALLALPGTAMAQASQACQRQCESQIRGGTPRDMQVCLIRCSAGEDYLARQRQPGTPEASGRGAAPGSEASPQERGTLSLVAYVGPLPATGLGLSRRVDRNTAHRAAQWDCYRRSGQRACRLLLETQQRCIAVARSLRALALVITDDPTTYQVLSYGAGDGPDLATARRGAMRDCAARQEPGTTCRMTISRCG